MVVLKIYKQGHEPSCADGNVESLNLKGRMNYGHNHLL